MKKARFSPILVAVSILFVILSQSGAGADVHDQVGIPVDVQVVSMTLDAPETALVGMPFDLTVNKVVRADMGEVPMAALQIGDVLNENKFHLFIPVVAELIVAAPPDCTVIPDPLNPVLVELPVNEDVPLVETFSITCTDSSSHSFTVENWLRLEEPEGPVLAEPGPDDYGLFDPDETNNHASASVTVGIVRLVDVEIVSQNLWDKEERPGEEPPFRCKSGTPPPEKIKVSDQKWVCLEKTLRNNDEEPVTVEVWKEVDAPDPGDGPIVCDKSGKTKFYGVFAGTNGGGGDIGADVGPGLMAESLKACSKEGSWIKQEMIPQGKVDTKSIKGAIGKACNEVEPGQEFVFYLAAHSDGTIYDLDGEQAAMWEVAESLGCFKQSVTVTAILESCCAGGFFRFADKIKNREGHTQDHAHFRVLAASKTKKAFGVKGVGGDFTTHLRSCLKSEKADPLTSDQLFACAKKEKYNPQQKPDSWAPPGPSKPTEVSIHIDRENETVTIKEGVTYYEKIDSDGDGICDKKVRKGVGPEEIKDPPVSSCWAVDSKPRVFKELDVHFQVTLPPGEDVKLEENFDVHCHGKGTQRFKFQNTVLPAGEHEEDPKPENNSKSNAHDVKCVGKDKEAPQEPELKCKGFPPTHTGTPGDDTIWGTGGRDVIMGLSGNDTIYGLGGDDVICAGSGNDKVFGGTGNDEINCDQGDDKCYGDAGHDTIRGDAGDDTVIGGPGGDLLEGGDGVDTLRGEDGTDSLYGGNGGDTLDGGNDRDMLDGEAGDDEMEGGEGRDIMWGRKGDDKMSGGDGTDTLRGGSGNDELRGDADGDFLYGGDGEDELEGGAGEDSLWGDSGKDTLKGGAGIDKMWGGSGNDRLHGGTEGDKMSGGDGVDILEGDDGDDNINGDDGDDFLYGGNGDDILNGGAGNDYLNGGLGTDTCVRGEINQNCE